MADDAAGFVTGHSAPRYCRIVIIITADDYGNTEVDGGDDDDNNDDNDNGNDDDDYDDDEDEDNDQNDKNADDNDNRVAIDRYAAFSYPFYASFARCI